MTLPSFVKALKLLTDVPADQIDQITAIAAGIPEEDLDSFLAKITEWNARAREQREIGEADLARVEAVVAGAEREYRRMNRASASSEESRERRKNLKTIARKMTRKSS